MLLKKNTASQKVTIYAWNDGTGAPKTGDAANITAQISLDGGATAATNDTNPTELDATDAPGVYIFDLTQAETNADLIVISPVSSMANVVIRPVFISTVDVDEYKANVSNLALEANIETHVTSALTSYDPPTRTELTSDKEEIIAATSVLNNLSLTEIMEYVIEGTLKFEDVIRIILAVLAGKASGGGTTSISYRNVADSKDRVTVTVDVYGNRTGVTIDGE